MLVGRAAECARLRRLASDTRAGRGGAVLLRGEAGVGKTRLTTEVAERARADGMEVLVGRAVEGGGAYRPLADALLARQREAALPEPAAIGPFAPALARLVPGWAPEAASTPVVDPTLLLSEGLLRLLRVVGAERGVLLVLDDLHWADADTLAVVDRLAESISGYPVLLLLTARPEGQPALDRLAAGGHVEVLPLPRLAPDDVGTLAAACAEDDTLPEHVRRHVADHADGLPFLVEELLGGLVDSGALTRTAAGWEAPADLRGPVPASFAMVVRQKLDGLDPAARAVVDAAAVIGRVVDWRLLPGVTGSAEAVVLDALRVAVDRGLLVFEGETFRFVHALTREAVLDRLLPPQRAAIAAAAATVVDVPGGDRELAADLHARSGNRARAAALLVEAARAAGGALGTREQLLRRAAELAPHDPDVAAALVDVLALAGRVSEAQEIGEPLLARLPAGDPRRARVALTMARAAVTANRWADAERHVDVARESAGAAADAVAAHVAFGRQQPEEALALAQRAVQAGGPVEVTCEALEMVGRVARHRDRRDEAEAAFAQAAGLAARHGLLPWRARALHELGTLDMLGPARPERLQAAREVAVSAGMLSTVAVIDLQLMACYGLRMDHPECIEVALRGRELGDSLRLPVISGASAIFLGLAYGHTGRYAEMHASLDEAELLLVDEPDQLATLDFARATRACVEHDLPAWQAALRSGMELVRKNASASPSPFRGIYALVETVLDGDPGARDELRHSGATVQAANAAALAYADAVATARAGGDPGRHLAEAETLMEPLVWRRHYARLLTAPAALQDGWGGPVDWLREAAGYFTDRGDAALARACRDLLRSAGAPVPRRGRGDSAVPPELHALGVTSREMDVLALVADGLPNAVIAERLFLSPRTVETHVASLLAKTGAAGRGDLTAYRPLTP